MVNTMNDHNHERDLALDGELAALDRELRERMPAQASADLANRIYRSTVADLPQREVIARLGWTSWTGWKYAAAIALVFFYSVLWIKPHMMPTTISDREVALTIHAVGDEPAIALDERIDTVAARLERLAADVGAEPVNVLGLGEDDDTLTEQLLLLDEQLGTIG